jgi:hypothetical protein
MALVLLEGVASVRADAAAAEREAEALREALRRARADRTRAAAAAAAATDSETSAASTQAGDDSDEERVRRQAAACRRDNGPAASARKDSERPLGRVDHLAAARRLFQRADPLDHDMGEPVAPARWENGPETARAGRRGSVAQWMRLRSDWPDSLGDGAGVGGGGGFLGGNLTPVCMASHRRADSEPVPALGAGSQRKE